MEEQNLELMTTAEVAKYLKISVGTLYTYMHRVGNPIPFIKIDRTVRFFKHKVEEWLLSPLSQ